MQSRYENALAQRESHPEEVVREFRLMAEETPDINWKAALLLHEVRCYELLGRLDDADRVLKEIRKLAPIDDIRLDVSFVGARVSSQRAEHKKAALQYESMLQEYSQLLETEEHRDDYEDICIRRAMELASSSEYREAVSIFKEAESFSTLTDKNQQQVHLWLGICYAELCEDELAIQEFLRVIAFNFINETVAESRYRVAQLYFRRGGFAQAKHHLETILQEYKEVALTFPIRYLYDQLSRACHYLGEKENAKHYSIMAQTSEHE